MNHFSLSGSLCQRAYCSCFTDDKVKARGGGAGYDFPKASDLTRLVNNRALGIENRPLTSKVTVPAWQGSDGAAGSAGVLGCRCGMSRQVRSSTSEGQAR